MFIALVLFPEKTQLKWNIIDKLSGYNEKKEILNPKQVKEGVSNDHGAHDLPEKNADDMGLPEDIESGKYSVAQNGEATTFTDGLLEAEDMSSQKNDVDDGSGLSVGNDKCEMDSVKEDAEGGQLNIPQHTDQDTTKEDLERFVAEFIGAMSFKMEARFLKDPSSHSALFSICVEELPIFHPDIETWEYVRVTYFTSDTTDEDVQQEIELIHKLEKRPDAFVIVACATDRMYRRVRENIVGDRKNSIMLLCYEHQDEAYICLKKHLKSDRKCFEFFKPDSQKYFYM